MDLDFLDEDVSKEPPKPIMLAPNILQYSKEETNLDGSIGTYYDQFKQMPYMQEAVKIAEQAQVILVDSLAEAFNRRCMILPTDNMNLTLDVFKDKQGVKVEVQRCLTYRECQNLYRSCGSYEKALATLKSSFLWDSIIKLVGIVIEEDEENSSLVFFLRYRYNRAYDFIRSKRDSKVPADIENCQKAKESLGNIEQGLRAAGHPMFPVEIEGFNLELLKPECFTFKQFAKKIRDRPVNPALADAKIQASFITFLNNL